LQAKIVILLAFMIIQAI